MACSQRSEAAYASRTEEMLRLYAHGSAAEGNKSPVKVTRGSHGEVMPGIGRCHADQVSPERVADEPHCDTTCHHFVNVPT